MKVIFIYDQVQAGAGGKEKPNVELQAKRGGIGSYLMLKPHLDSIGVEVIATIYCGDNYFKDNEAIVIPKVIAMIKKLNPDIVVAGPAFNYAGYAYMACVLTKAISNEGFNAIAMMSSENTELISDYSQIIKIVKMPKKGGIGLNDSIRNACSLMKAISTNTDIESISKCVCY